MRDKDTALLAADVCPGRPLAAAPDGPGRWLVATRPASGLGAGEPGCEWTLSVQSQVRAGPAAGAMGRARPGREQRECVKLMSDGLIQLML